MIQKILLAFLCGWSLTASASEIPHLVQQQGRYALYVDGKPYFILGAQIHNSSAWPAVLPQVWPAIEFIHANTVEAPVYWEQLEPQPGKFDFTNVDAVVDQARSHHLHVIFLWFGTWKNARCHYTPEWVKTDIVRYPRLLDDKGRVTDSMSPFGDNTLEADKDAFAALMRHLKQIDGEQHTVIMVQVENESGSLDSVRDFSPRAQTQFAAPVPKELVDRLNLRPGTWEEVFGGAAAEKFQAYAVARYIDEVAAAGKREFNLPMYVNAWVRSPDDLEPEPPRSYPSGGATDVVLDLWKAATHSIDLIGPDIYLEGAPTYRQIVSAYRRPDNALFVPENSHEPAFASYPFIVLDEGGIGFTVWGVDHVNTRDDVQLPAATSFPELVGFERTFELLSTMHDELSALTFSGKAKAVVEGEEPGGSRIVPFGDWKAVITFSHENAKSASLKQPAAAWIAELSANEFLVAGFDVHVELLPTHADPRRRWQILKVEEGGYENNAWKMRRLLNGDECDFGVDLGETGRVLRMKMGMY